MFVENFSPTEAFPIANFLIFICSIITFYMGVKDKYANPSNSFVDYDMAILFCPTLLLGTKVGTMLNRVLSNLILSIFLAIVVFYSMSKTYKSATAQRKKEDESTRKEFEYTDLALNQNLVL